MVMVSPSLVPRLSVKIIGLGTRLGLSISQREFTGKFTTRRYSFST